jgi:hypothetical protein
MNLEALEVLEDLFLKVPELKAGKDNVKMQLKAGEACVKMILDCVSWTSRCLQLTGIEFVKSLTLPT